MTEAPLEAMTVNERLFALGELDAFDAAMAVGDVVRIRAILGHAKVDPPSVERIARRITRKHPRLTEKGGASGTR